MDKIRNRMRCSEPLSAQWLLQSSTRKQRQIWYCVCLDSQPFLNTQHCYLSCICVYLSEPADGNALILIFSLSLTFFPSLPHFLHSPVTLLWNDTRYFCGIKYWSIQLKHSKSFINVNFSSCCYCYYLSLFSFIQWQNVNNVISLIEGGFFLHIHCVFLVHKSKLSKLLLLTSSD